MCHLVSVNPRDIAVIHVGDLEHRVDPWISCTSFTEKNLTHPPALFEQLGNLLFSLDDHPIASLNAEDCRWLGSCHWADG